LRFLLAVVVTLFSWSSQVWAAKDEPAPERKEASKEKATQPSATEPELEPKVTIIQSDQDTFQEYRVNGKLYMIEVVPKHGRPYYLVDADGDGSLESRRSELDPDFLIPQWTLFRWK